ncbi:MAG: hypothetical protein JXR65_00965 [Bacteroidales bacterium]|nr:hypothetical protein [Bacteroidales bacterium]
MTIKKNLIFSFLLFLNLVFSGCSKKETTDNQLNLTSSNPPFTLTTKATFYKDVSYGSYDKNILDLFLPLSDHPTPLVIFIHGGGFKGGDKDDFYFEPGNIQLINYLLENKIAFSNLDYRFLEEDDTVGALRSMRDCKIALQFLRYYAPTLNIEKSDVVLLGSSAGAGTSLWIAFHDDMAIPDSPDKILQESTRVKGAVCADVQATYDVLQWPDTVFAQYKSQGMSLSYMENLEGDSTITKFYGVKSISELYTDALKKRRKEMDFLHMLTGDDPEFYLLNTDVEDVFPSTSPVLLHHPLHSKTLLDRAYLVHVSTRAYISSMNIDTRNGESITDFILRKTKE